MRPFRDVYFLLESIAIMFFFSICVHSCCSHLIMIFRQLDKALSRKNLDIRDLNIWYCCAGMEHGRVTAYNCNYDEKVTNSRYSGVPIIHATIGLTFILCFNQDPNGFWCNLKGLNGKPVAIYSHQMWKEEKMISLINYWI